MGAGLVEHWIAELSVMLAQEGGNYIRPFAATLHCSFREPDEAVRCACAMQETVSKATGAVALRIGLHMARLTGRGEGCSGRPLLLAARMAQVAKPGQVICTGEVSRKTSEGLRLRMQPLPPDSARDMTVSSLEPHEIMWDRTGPVVAPGSISDISNAKRQPATVPLQPFKKSKSKKPIVLHRVKRKPAPAPVASSEPATAQAEPGVAAAAPAGAGPPAANRLCLICDDGVAITVDAQCPLLTIGRHPDSDILARIGTASRRHAEIRYENGALLLVDHSVNGTFAYNEKDEVIRFVHNETMMLTDYGVVSPGCQLDDPEGEHLLYRVEPDTPAPQPADSRPAEAAAADYGPDAMGECGGIEAVGVASDAADQ